MRATGGLAAVFVAQRPALLRLLRARLGSTEDAEDALQEMWFKVTQAAARPVADPAAYLFRMAANLATDRRLSATRAATLDSAWHEERPEADELDAERTLLARDRLVRAQAVLAAMPERMRTAYTLFRLDELPQREIAQRMGVSLSAVEKLLQRAYARFHALEESEHDRR
jgi:RNA polymerase sigma factor (sigma-70 family)